MFDQGAVPVVSSSFSQLPSGLWAPEAVLRPPAPIDQIATFLTGEQVFGYPVPTVVVLDHLRRLPLEGVLGVCAQLLADLDAPDGGQAAADRNFLDSFGPRGSARKRVEARLAAGGAVVVAPQVAMVLMKAAARWCGDAVLPGIEPGLFGMVWLGLADSLQRLDLKSEAEAEAQLVIGLGPPGVIEREVVASHHFHAQRELPHTVAKFMRRWVQLPIELAGHPRVVNLAEEFKIATGFSLEDFVTVGVTIHAAVLAHGPRFSRGYLNGLGLPVGTVEAILNHVRNSNIELRGWVAGEAGGQCWEFSHLEQFPVLELDNGDLLVLRPSLVLQRFFGWLPAFDVIAGLAAAGASASRRSRFEGCLAHLGEVYAGETLQAQAKRHRLRYYDGDQIKGALAPKGQQRTCDASLDDSRRWALFEMTSSRLTRDSVNASSADRLEADLSKLVSKVEQLDDTIAGLRARESALTGATSAGPRHYYPALVMTEGFPVNPVTLTALRQRATDLGLLHGDDVGPLQILDVGELEILEGADPGEPSILDALEVKPSASLALAGMRDYLLVERRIRASVPERVEKLWVGAFEIAKNRVEAD